MATQIVTTLCTLRTVGTSLTFTTNVDQQKEPVRNMRRTVAEQVRAVSPELAEALEERLFSDQEIVDELRGRAYDHPHVSDAFYQWLACASAVEDLEDYDD